MRKVNTNLLSAQDKQKNAFFRRLERQLQESTKNILALFPSKMDDPILLNQAFMKVNISHSFSNLNIVP